MPGAAATAAAVILLALLATYGWPLAERRRERRQPATAHGVQEAQ